LPPFAGALVCCPPSLDAGLGLGLGLSDGDGDDDVVSGFGLGVVVARGGGIVVLHCAGGSPEM
jgi:hypothetical protein